MNKKKCCKNSMLSIFLLIASIFVAAVGIAMLVTNIMYFNDTVSNYVTQGYQKATVLKEFIPSRLLPAIYETAGLYFGVAFLLFGMSMLTRKISYLCGHDEEAEIEEALTEEPASEESLADMNEDELRTEIKEEIKEEQSEKSQDETEILSDDFDEKKY